MNWKYKNRLLPDKAPSSWGFVYLITYDDNTSYVGKKQMWSSLTREAKKNGTEREGHSYFTNKRKGGKIVKHEVTITENDWRTYSGSSKATKHLKIKNKEILQFYTDRLNLTYGELEWMIKLDVLRCEGYHNDNILGKFFKPKIV